MIVIRWIIYLAVWAWIGKTLLYSEAFEEWFNSLHPFVVVALLVGLVIVFIMGVGAFVAGNDPETKRIIDDIHRKNGQPTEDRTAKKRLSPSEVAAAKREIRRLQRLIDGV